MQKGFCIFAGAQTLTLLGLGLSRLEAFDTTGSVHHLLLTSIEWMRRTRDINVRQWVLIPIFPLISDLGLDGRTNEKSFSTRVVVENNETVVLWVDISFHSAATLPKNL